MALRCCSPGEEQSLLGGRAYRLQLAYDCWKPAARSDRKAPAAASVYLPQGHKSLPSPTPARIGKRPGRPLFRDALRTYAGMLSSFTPAPFAERLLLCARLWSMVFVSLFVADLASVLPLF